MGDEGENFLSTDEGRVPYLGLLIYKMLEKSEVRRERGAIVNFPHTQVNRSYVKLAPRAMEQH